MELTTFGAVMRFAIELEAEGERRYQQGASAATGAARQALSDAARAKRKRRQGLERTRQENVAEMILETIRDLDGDCYHSPPAPAGADVVAAVSSLANFEERSGAYYRAAGQKIGIAEVTRAFERLARENAEQQAKLAALG